MLLSFNSVSLWFVVIRLRLEVKLTSWCRWLLSPWCPGSFCKHVSSPPEMNEWWWVSLPLRHSLYGGCPLWDSEGKKLVCKLSDEINKQTLNNWEWEKPWCYSDALKSTGLRGYMDEYTKHLNLNISLLQGAHTISVSPINQSAYFFHCYY